ncbi:class I SAM-dependent methyltransferase [Desulfatirhabdium butyrativorans]|uniref:class I SAM-dependent methyltransferase n=1 Tax=Desulfatirhabdium butyrativorans TaxID=340467 RepID=UPI000484DBC0|nr:class I SAM-dependent methyltransferase [Desulfatirhabdium butyrativorans]
MTNQNNEVFENTQKAHFDQFFEKINLSDNTALTIEFSTLLEFIGDLKGKRILDLGCGLGRNGLQLAKYANEVIGYDISDIAISKANQYAKQLGINNFHAELNNFSDVDDACFDVILCVNMLHHCASPPQVLNTIRKALCVGGQLIVMENNPLNPLFPSFFFFIGQFKAHCTKQYFMVNRFSLVKQINTTGMSVKQIQRYGFLPTMLYNYSLKFKVFNEVMNRVPILNELTAFYLIKAEKHISNESVVSPRRNKGIQ